MHTLRLPNSDLTVSALCLGVPYFGCTFTGQDMYDRYRAFRTAGGNFFDSAHCYSFWLPNGDGASERGLGACVRHFNERDRVVIATKGGHPPRPGYAHDADHLAPTALDRDLSESLDRLGMKFIDLYWLHRDDPRKPVGDIVETLNTFVRQGRVRYLGASNWTTARLAAANAYAAARQLQGFIAAQPRWNLAHPLHPVPPADPTMLFYSDADIAWHVQQKIPVIPYSPTACGYFATAGAKAASDFDTPTSRQRLARAQQLAQRLPATPNQIALAYLMNQPFPVVPILGTSDPTHLHDALGSATLRLTAADLHWLRHG